MCEPASFVVTKDKVFWSRKTDRHEEVIDEFKLAEMVAGKCTLVRVEISPKNGDLTTPLDQWAYILDQDIKPEWYDAEEVEKRCRAALQEWYSEKVISRGEIRVSDRQIYACGRATVIAHNGATVEAFASATVKAFDSVTVIARDSVTVRAFDSATVEAFDSATVIAHNGATVKAFDSATVEAFASATVRAFDSATVIAFDSVTVNSYTGKKPNVKDNAVWIDRSGDKPVVTIGK